MTQVALIELTKDWEDLEDAISEATETEFTFDTTKTYQIECRGNGRAFLVEQVDDPTAGSKDGVMLDNSGMKVVKYKKGTNVLYGRAESSCLLNITVLGE